MSADAGEKLAAVLLDQLAEKAAEIKRLEEELEEARRDLWALELRAKEERIPIAVIAKAAGRSRDTLYKDLERARELRAK